MDPTNTTTTGPAGTLDPRLVHFPATGTEPFLPRPQTKEEIERVQRYDNDDDFFEPTAAAFQRRIEQLLLPIDHHPATLSVAIIACYQNELSEDPPQLGAYFAVMDQFRAWCSTHHIVTDPGTQPSVRRLERVMEVPAGSFKDWTMKEMIEAHFEWSKDKMVWFPRDGGARCELVTFFWANSCIAELFQEKRRGGGDFELVLGRREEGWALW